VWMDGPTGWLGRSLGVQTLEYTLADFVSEDCSDVVALPFEPVIDIVSITYLTAGGSLAVVPPEGYELVHGGVRPVSGFYWPSVGDSPDAVKIRYRAGYGKPQTEGSGALVNDVPAAIKVALMMLIAQWYLVREPVSLGDTVENLPFAVDALLQPYRIYR